MAVFAAALLLFVAPLMRGGNRQAALVMLESIALAFLLALWLNHVFSDREPSRRSDRITVRTLLIGFLVLSPAWLALVYLTPLQSDLWSSAPGRGIYLELLNAAGHPSALARPLSLAPDLTLVSLLAGIPLVAAFLAGYTCKLPQLRWLLTLVVVIAFFQVVLGLLQVAGGASSILYFGGDGGRPIGTFANPNHFANYIAMALAAYIVLAWHSLLKPQSRRRDGAAVRFAAHHATALWIAGGVVLALGIVMSRSRGAALTGLPVALLALGVALSANGRENGWRLTLALGGAVAAGAVALVGFGAVLSRFEMSGVGNAASIRGLIASTTLDGAAAFWPWGAGWGTYAAVYPRFQPMGMDGVVDYAHHDYAQMLFDGGIFAVALAAAFLWLAVSRAILLARSAFRRRALDAEEMSSALCGLGLLGLLLHSLVEFNMHIPANAILGALLAGVYLRPLPLQHNGQS